MPATSEKQKRFMDAAAHNPSFAKKVGVPQSVAQEFSGKSKGMSFGKGDRTRVDRQGINKPKTDHGNSSLFKKGGDTMASKMNPGFMAMMAKKKGMQEGSKADMMSDKKQMMGMKKGGMKKMADGGSASSRADGVAVKGKTKGKMLKKGGKA
jgi:hypothetical protein